MIISLNQLNPEQIAKYDNIIALVCKSTLDKSKNRNHSKDTVVNIPESRLVRLIKCTNVLDIPDSEHEVIFINFTQLIGEIGGYMDPITLDIMLPIFFFTSVLKNELKPNTNAQRARRGTTIWGKTHDPLLGIEKLYDQKIKDYETTFQKKCNELESSYKKYNKIKNMTSAYVSSELDEHVRNAQALFGKYSDINKIQNYANLGLFALKVLDTEHSRERPMITLVRMYILDQLCNLVAHCEKISNDFPIDVSCTGGLIARYYYNDEPHIDRQLSRHGLGYLRKIKKVERVDSSKTVSIFSDNENHTSLDNYHAVYFREEILYHTTLTNKEVLKIKDYYFNEQKLKWYSDYCRKATTYLADIITTLNYSIHLEKKYDHKEKFTAFLNKEFIQD